MVAATRTATTMAATIIIPFFIIAGKGTTIVINEQTIWGFLMPFVPLLRHLWQVFRGMSQNSGVCRKDLK